MEFKTLFPILKKYLADDADVPCFFRELMAMVTTVTEEEWGSSKDPSTKTNAEEAGADRRNDPCAKYVRFIS